MTRLHANALLLLTAAIWGTSFIAQKYGLAHMTPAAFSAIRFVLGAAVIAPLATIRRRRSPAPRPLSGKDWAGMIVTGLCLSLGAITQQTGIASTSVTNAGFLTALYVPFVPLIALAALGRKPHPIIWPAVAASLYGAWALSGGGSVGLSRGDAWVVLSAVFWAVHVLLIDSMSRRVDDPALLAAIQFSVAALFACLLVFASGEVPWTGLAASWAEVAYVGIFSVGVGFTLQGAAQRFTAPADAAIILSAEVLFAALGGALVFGDRLSPLMLSGCLAILAAMAAVQIVPLLKRKGP